MITTEHLTNSFDRNLRIIQMQTDGLSHSDSILQAPFRANCLNWVLGHIAASRDSVLRMLGEDALLTKAETILYKRESDPVIGDGDDVAPLERLLGVLELGQEGITVAMGRIKPEAFSEEMQVGKRTMSLGERLHFLYFHDTYHTGQTELLRQLAGKDDKVI